MVRNKSEDMLMEDELAATFLADGDNSALMETEEVMVSDGSNDEPSVEEGTDGWEETEDFPGQLAVDVYETADKLIVKARTAGISRKDLDVSISDNILTISGILSGGEDENTTKWHIQECM